MPLNNNNQYTERFKFRNEPLNSKQENNISCNWLLISGGLKEFSKQSNLKTLNKYGIIKMIRQIDGINYYGITQELFTYLEKTLDEKLLAISACSSEAQTTPSTTGRTFSLRNLL